MCSKLYYLGLCTYTVCVRTTKKSPKDALLRTYSRR